MLKTNSRREETKANRVYNAMVGFVEQLLKAIVSLTPEIAAGSEYSLINMLRLLPRCLSLFLSFPLFFFFFLVPPQFIQFLFSLFPSVLSKLIK